MRVSVCPDCYEKDVLSEGLFIEAYAREGEVYQSFRCEKCGLVYEENIGE